MIAQDHFSGCASQYAAFRPRYPVALYQWLASVAPTRKLVWDCACGNGQASVDLIEHFQEVIGTDLSTEQLAHAVPHDRIAYRVAVAEASGLPNAEFDVVTVAQALHWFDLDRFYAEVRRVLRPDGVLAVWCYGMCEITETRGNALLRHFYEQVSGPYWQPERRLVETGYRTMRFPAPELTAPDFAMVLDWSLNDLLGYVGSWSATACYVKERGTDPVPRPPTTPPWMTPRSSARP